MRDLHHNLTPAIGTQPIAIGTTGTGQAGAIVDRRGYRGVEFFVQYGAVTATDAVFTAVMKEGDATGSLTSVADADMLGTEAGAGLGAAVRVNGTTKNVTKRVGYIGVKRYVKLSVSSTVTAGAPIAVLPILGEPLNRPVAT